MVAGLSKQWNTTNNNYNNGGFHYNTSSKISPNTTTVKERYEMTKETKSIHQYHLSKRKLLSFLSQHLESSTSPYFSSSKTHENITQLANDSQGKEILRQTRIEDMDSNQFLKPNFAEPPKYNSVSVTDIFI